MNINRYQRNAERISWGDRVFFGCLIGYLAVLSVSNTIALRNILLVGAIGFVFFHIVIKYPKNRNELRYQFSRIPIIFIAWCLYLLLFPFWAIETDSAWKNLRGQWLEMILAWSLGFGAVIVLGRRSPSLWLLALASAFPVILHLMLTLFVWAGLAGNAFQADPSIYSLGLTLRSWVSDGLPSIKWQPFPIGFRGVEPMHGNIGYSAGQAVVLATACFIAAWRKNYRKMLVLSSALILICFVSVFIASSRGAVIFNILIIAVAFATYRMKYCIPNETATTSIIRSSKIRAGLLGFAVVFILIFGVWSSKSDVRWYSMFDKVELGFTMANPGKVLCDGLTSEEEGAIRRRFAGRDKEYQDDLIAGLMFQDGVRILLMREGWDLLKRNPVGLDGSRQSYEKLMRNECGHEPRIAFGHAHQAWINIGLALGWAGALIFFATLSYFTLVGLRLSGRTDSDLYAFSLFLLGSFWIFRGLGDAVFQDHYLQMQGFLLAFLYMRLVFQNDIGAFEK